MLITVVRGDVFRSRAQTLTNTVNCSGVMCAGLARSIASWRMRTSRPSASSAPGGLGHVLTRVLRTLASAARCLHEARDGSGENGRQLLEASVLAPNISRERFRREWMAHRYQRMEVVRIATTKKAWPSWRGG